MEKEYDYDDGHHNSMWNATGRIAVARKSEYIRRLCSSASAASKTQQFPRYCPLPWVKTPADDLPTQYEKAKEWTKSRFIIIAVLPVVIQVVFKLALQTGGRRRTSIRRASSPTPS